MTRKVLLIDIDDVGLALLDAACDTGGAPNMAAMRAGGMDFRRFWSAPLCSLFRAQVLTGCEAHKPQNYVGALVDEDGTFEGPVGPWITKDMPGTKTKRGKWHMSGDVHMPHAVVRVGGYDQFSGVTGNLYNAGSVNYYDWIKGEAVPGTYSKTPCSTFATSDTANVVLGDIASGYEFIHASFNSVHTPMNTPPANEPTSHLYQGHGFIAKRADLLFHLDWWLGQIVTAATAADYVTIIVGDNGSAQSGKGSLYESGLSTPLFVVGNGVLAGTSMRLVDAVDLFATVRYLRGAPLVHKTDSINFADAFLSGATRQESRRTLVCEQYGQVGVPPDPAHLHQTIRDARWKLIDKPDADTGAGESLREFFDLLKDPTEDHDLLLGTMGMMAQAAYTRLCLMLRLTP